MNNWLPENLQTHFWHATFSHLSFHFSGSAPGATYRKRSALRNRKGLACETTLVEHIYQLTVHGLQGSDKLLLNTEHAQQPAAVCLSIYFPFKFALYFYLERLCLCIAKVNTKCFVDAQCAISMDHLIYVTLHYHYCVTYIILTITISINDYRYHYIHDRELEPPGPEAQIYWTFFPHQVYWIGLHYCFH